LALPDEEKLEPGLFGAAQPSTSDANEAAPDFAAIHEQKQRYRHVTLQIKIIERTRAV
jgi:hypothetical protein